MSDVSGPASEAVANLRGKRVLVTGGTGFLGRHVLEHGRKLGATMWNLSTQAGDVAGVTYLQGDLRQAEAIRGALDAADPAVVLHLGAAGVTYATVDFSTMLEVNGAGMELLLSEILKRNRGTAVVTTGTCYEYAESPERLTESSPLAPSNPYSLTKAAASLIAGYYARETPVTLLRLFNVYGPGERAPRLLPYIVDNVKRAEVVEVTPSEQLRDFVFAPDAAFAVWLAAARPPSAGAMRVLNVGTGVGTSLRTFIEQVATALRGRGHAPDIRFGARAYRPGEAMHVVADPRRLQTTLDWVPSTPLGAGIAAAVESML